MKRFPISKVLDLTQQNKFEVICAAFDAVDHIFKVDIPRSLKGRKSAIQAMTLLADDQLKYGYDEYSFQNLPEDESNQESSDALPASGVETPETILEVTNKSDLSH